MYVLNERYEPYLVFGAVGVKVDATVIDVPFMIYSGDSTCSLEGATHFGKGGFANKASRHIFGQKNQSHALNYFQ